MSATTSTGSTGLQEWLLRADGHAYAVLDAAREARVLAAIVASSAAHESLYEGHQGAALADVAPYLVCVEGGSPLLAELERGWGRDWGIFLTSRSSRRALRARLRRLLMVKVGDSPRPMYFRFYDPRVLRVLLPMATPRQVSWFFGDGEVDAYLAEDRDPRVGLVMTEAAAGTVRVERVALGGEEGGTGARAG